MPSEFEALFEELATPELHSAFSIADSVIYTPASGSPTTFDAIKGSVETKRRVDSATGLQVLVNVVTVTVLDSEMPRASVKQNGTVTIGSDKYSIQQISDVFAGEYTIEAVGEKLNEIGRPKLRPPSRAYQG